jgi:hypothetical protein
MFPPAGSLILWVQLSDVCLRKAAWVQKCVVPQETETAHYEILMILSLNWLALHWCAHAYTQAALPLLDLQGVMKNGPGYLDVAVCSHMDMLKVNART